MLAAILPFLLALARAVPAIDDLFSQVVTVRAQDRAAAASQRLADKDARVDAAIDGKAAPQPPSSSATP